MTPCFSRTAVSSTPLQVLLLAKIESFCTSKTLNSAACAKIRHLTPRIAAVLFEVLANAPRYVLYMALET